jgi:DUF2971 family protein
MSSDQIRSAVATALKPYSDASRPLVEAMLSATNSLAPPDHIYHYTSGVKLQNILATGEFWFTHIAHLNDTSELTHGTSFARQRIEESARKGGEFERFAPPLLNGLDEPVRDVAQFFVGSFSCASDDLCQWRAYADNARGFAIGLDRALFEEAARADSDDHVQSYFISYDDAPLKALHTQLLDVAFRLVPTIGRHMGSLAMDLSGDLIMTALLFKHSAYLNEQEYRLLEMHAKGADLGKRQRQRQLDGKEVPYVAVNWRDIGRAALKSITIGPAGDVDSAREFVNTCLQAGGFDTTAVTVTKSPIPYRA